MNGDFFEPRAAVIEIPFALIASSELVEAKDLKVASGSTITFGPDEVAKSILSTCDVPGGPLTELEKATFPNLVAFFSSTEIKAGVPAPDQVETLSHSIMILDAVIKNGTLGGGNAESVQAEHMQAVKTVLLSELSRGLKRIERQKERGRKRVERKKRGGNGKDAEDEGETSDPGSIQPWSAFRRDVAARLEDDPDDCNVRYRQSPAGE